MIFSKFKLSDTVVPLFLRGVLYLSLFFCLEVAAQIDQGEKLIPEDLKGKSIKAVFRYMGKEFDFEFAYDAQLIKSKTCLEQYSYLDAEDLLSKVITPHDLSYRKAGSVYLILPTPKLPEDIAPGVITKTDFELTGRVIDKSTREVLPYAFLRLQNTNIWTETNIDGRFSFKNIPSDTLLLGVNYLGYNLFLERLNRIDETNPIIELEVLGAFLSQVDITNNKLDAISLDDLQGYHQMDPAQIDLISGNGQPDLFKGLQLLAGIQTEDASSSSLSIRNSQESENLVLFDGIPIYHISHFLGIYSTINPDFVKSVRLYKSAFGAEFSDRIGGVVDITGKAGDLNKTGLKFNTNLISAGLFLETPIVKGKTSLALGLRQSHTNQFRSKLYENLLNINLREGINGSGFMEDVNLDQNVSLAFYDFNVKVNHHFNDDLMMSFHVFNAKDEYENELQQNREGDIPLQRFGRNSIDDSNWNSLGLGVNVSNQWNSKFHSYLTVGLSEYESKYFFNDLDLEFQNDFVINRRLKSGSQQNNLQDYSAILKNTYNWKDNQELQFGIDVHRYRQNNWELEEIVGLEVLNQFLRNRNEQTLFSAFVIDRIKINDSWRLNTGLRLSKFQSNEKVQLYPRIELRKQISPQWSAKIAGGIYGQYLRRVSDERVSQNQPDEWLLTSRNIPLARSSNVSAGIHYKSDDWVVKLEGYYKDNEGSLINAAQDSLQSVNELSSSSLLLGESKVLGADLTVLRNYKNHSSWLSYSLSRSYSQFRKINNGLTFPSPNNRLHDLKINYQYRIKKWSLATSFIYATGKPFTPVLGTFENELSGQQFLVFGDDFSARLPDYSRLDIGVKYNVIIGSSVIEMGAGIYNVLDRKNFSQRYYEAFTVGSGLDADLQINEIDLELLGISPNFNISYTIN